ncbi:MAG: hypothetical protein IT437_03990 [Phycisphaerales bacterium]|nr:hypothetical protein [Phycisphaerales bacterium]
MTSSQGFDSTGRWYREQDEVVHPPGKPDYSLRGRCAWDGFALTGVDDLSRTGTIQEYTGWRMPEMGPDCWFGRQFDVSSGRTLPEFLLTAPDLRMGPVSSNGLPVICATVENIQFIATVEIELDPEHGFAPRSLTYRDATIRVPYDRYEVLEFERHGDLWLPRRGRLETRYFHMTTEQSAAFREAKQRHGLTPASDARDPGVQAEYRRVLREAFGADEAPSAVMVPAIEVTWTYTNVNGAVPAQEFTVPFPEDYNVLNCFTNRVRKPGEAEWVDND